MGVVDLEGHPLPVQLDLLGVDQLGTVLILTDEPSIWKCRSWIYVNVDKTEMYKITHLDLLVRNLTARADLPTPRPPAITILRSENINQREIFKHKYLNNIYVPERNIKIEIFRWNISERSTNIFIGNHFPQNHIIINFLMHKSMLSEWSCSFFERKNAIKEWMQTWQ